MNRSDMDGQVNPLVSVVMPVFNTGVYLVEAINSVLNQQAVPDCELPEFELLIVDDHSTDQKTLGILDAAASSDSRIRLLKNQRPKGAAGARNTGIMNARGTWIGFLDSDDIWLPNSLVLRWRVVLENANARWVGARFRLLRPTTVVNDVQIFERAENLIAGLDKNINPTEIACLPRPVEAFGNSCMVGIMTVLIQRALIVEKELFNEQLRRTEDYHLWFKCAFDTDLWMLEADVAFYRIHSGSLTHGNTPKYLYEDTMIKLLLVDPVGAMHKTTLTKRFDLVMQDHCYFYRGQKLFGAALGSVLRWIAKRPLNASAWKELVACSLRIS